MSKKKRDPMIEILGLNKLKGARQAYELLTRRSGPLITLRDYMDLPDAVKFKGSVTVEESGLWNVLIKIKLGPFKRFRKRRQERTEQRIKDYIESRCPAIISIKVVFE